MRFKQQCLNQNNVHIVCWVLFFWGLFCNSAALSRLHVHKRAFAQIFWEGLGEGKHASTKGKWKRRLSLSSFMSCVVTTFQNPASQPALAKESLISFRLCHGERKKDPLNPLSPLIMASVCFPLIIFPPQSRY